MQVQMCPVCGSRTVEPVRSASMSSGDKRLQSFRCAAGHVFYVPAVNGS